VTSVPAEKWAAINGGKLAGSVITTDPRAYAFSAVIPLPELSGPLVLRVPIKVASGEIGAVITNPLDQSDFVVEVEANASSNSGFVDLAVPDATQAKQIILRNRVPNGASVATIGPVQVFRPAAESQVPARGVHFQPPVPVQSAVRRTSEGIYKLRGVDELNLVSIAITQDATPPVGGKFLVGADTAGFSGSVRVVDKDGKTLATKALPRVPRPDVVELQLASLPDAAYLVFSSRDPKARGDLRIQSVVAFAADGR
jgi:hypothetical protein